MTLKYLTANNILKLIYNPYKTKDKYYKLHWNMKCGTEIYIHKTLENLIWYIRLAVGRNISLGNASGVFFMSPHLALGALNPCFPRYTISVCVHANQTKCFPPLLSEQSVWIFLTIFFFLFLDSLSGLSKGASCFPSDVFSFLSLISISAYVARLLSPAYQSGLLYIFCKHS
jgi:hypothetical protein